MNEELHRWSAVRLVRALATHDLSVSALARALIERSAALEPSLRAWAWFDPIKVMRTARELDRKSAAGPLHGLPIAVKDIIDTAGIPTSYGSPIYAGHVPTDDAACVSLARAAGGWVFGKSVTAELANMTPGPTTHPLDSERTPGGSSSGSAAAVAAGFVPLALGTQTAGSTIRPAAFCGIVGYKPSSHRIPRAGVKANSDTLDEVGVLARSVDDAALLGLALSGRDVATLPSTQAFAPSIGVTLTSCSEAASPDMAVMVAASARRLAKAGASVRDVVWPAGFDRLFDAHRVVQWFETVRALAPEWQYRRALLSRELARSLADGRSITGHDYRDALALAEIGKAALEVLFENLDVIIAPAAPGVAPRGLESTGDPLFSRPWQLLGCPCISLPGGLGEGGLPLGLQVIGRPRHDEALFAAAAWIEARLGS